MVRARDRKHERGVVRFQSGPLTKRQRELAIQAVLSSRVFNGPYRVNDGGQTRRFRLSQSLKDVLARLAEKALAGAPLTLADVTGPTPRSAKYGPTTVNHLGRRLLDYYRFEGFADPVRVRVFMQGGVVRMAFARASSQPADQEYERAVYHLLRLDPGHTEKALEHAATALAHEPQHAGAYAARAEALLVRAMNDYLEPSLPLLREAQAAAARAVELDPCLWRAHAALGAVCEWNMEFSRARAAFDRALALDRHGLCDSEPYYGHLIATGYLSQATVLAQSWVADRPADSLAHRALGMCLHIAGRNREAEIALRDALSLDPALWIAKITLALVYLEVGRAGDALNRMGPFDRQAPDAWPGLHILCLARAGQLARARTMLRRLEGRAARGYVQPFQLALASLAVGRHERAIEFLGEACAQRHPVLDWVDVFPMLEPLRTYASYRRLLTQFNVPDGRARATALRQASFGRPR